MRKVRECENVLKMKSDRTDDEWRSDSCKKDDGKDDWTRRRMIEQMELRPEQFNRVLEKVRDRKKAEEKTGL
jgi:hypothetical protein